MALNSGKILMRRGQEINFDPDKMSPGEWAVSLDTRYVRMCFAPGICVRMATYEAFEEDMKQIEAILLECQTIEEAVQRINAEINAKVEAVVEYVGKAKTYRDEAKTFRDEAEGFKNQAGEIAGIGIATNEKAGIVKPDGETLEVDIDGTMRVIGGGGVYDYKELDNKPSINGTELDGDMSLDDLGIASVSELEKTNYKVDTIIEHADLGIKETASGEEIHLTDSADGKAVEYALYGKATQNGEPTPENPIEIEVAGSSGSVEVKSVGKNLLTYPYSQKSKTSNGITFRDNGDGSVTMNGTATAIAFYYMKGDGTNESGFKLGGKYIVSTQNYISNNSYLRIGISGGANYNCTSEKEIEFPTNSDIFVCIRIGSGEVLNNVTFYPMIRLASDTDNTWQPYREPVITTIPTANELAGILALSGGNYTDTKGQSWICDELVKYSDGSGAYIQRIGKVIFDGSEDEQWLDRTNDYTDKTDGQKRFSLNNWDIVYKPSYYTAVMSNIGFSGMIDRVSHHTNDGVSLYIGQTIPSTKNYYITISNTEVTDLATFKTWLSNNNIVVYCELETPIETPLTAEEISTFYPTTNITNDFDCGMMVKYNCDSKNYIDKQLAEMEKAREQAMMSMFLLLPEETQASMIENDVNNLLTESEI